MYRPVKAGEIFTTFIFDGKDCADMGVYSTTSGGTYTLQLEPTFKDETLDVPAYDGRYYYGTQYTTQQFQFNLFADNLSMTEYRNLRTWLKPRNIGKLILSDQPYKYYIVKVTSIGNLGEIPLTDAQVQWIVKNYDSLNKQQHYFISEKLKADDDCKHGHYPDYLTDVKWSGLLF